jgi:DNA-binding protein HU-beta
LLPNSLKRADCQAKRNSSVGVKGRLGITPRLEKSDFAQEELQLRKGDNVNKSELIDAVAASADLPKAAAGRAIDAMLDTITDSLKKDDPVVLVGFGTFATKDRAARTGRNPQTGAPIEIKAAKVPSFKAGKALKDSVNS